MSDSFDKTSDSQVGSLDDLLDEKIEDMETLDDAEVKEEKKVKLSAALASTYGDIIDMNPNLYEIEPDEEEKEEEEKEEAINLPKTAPQQKEAINLPKADPSKFYKAASQQNKVAPQQNKVAPQQNKVAPQQKKGTNLPKADPSKFYKAASQQNKAAPQQNKAAPQQNKVAPQQNKAAPQQNKAAPQQKKGTNLPKADPSIFNKSAPQQKKAKGVQYVKFGEGAQPKDVSQMSPEEQLSYEKFVSMAACNLGRLAGIDKITANEFVHKYIKHMNNLFNEGSDKTTKFTKEQWQYAALDFLRVGKFGNFMHRTLTGVGYSDEEAKQKYPPFLDFLYKFYNIDRKVDPYHQFGHDETKIAAEAFIKEFPAQNISGYRRPLPPVPERNEQDPVEIPTPLQNPPPGAVAHQVASMAPAAAFLVPVYLPDGALLFLTPWSYDARFNMYGAWAINNRGQYFFVYCPAPAAQGGK